MKPFCPSNRMPLSEEETLFNYRLSRARKSIENAFGRLYGKWQCLARTMLCYPDKAQKIVSTCCVLHNLLLENPKESTCPESYADRYDENGQLIEGAWRQKTVHSHSVTNSDGRLTNEAKLIRAKLRDYVNSPQGAVQWQKKSAFLD